MLTHTGRTLTWTKCGFRTRQSERVGPQKPRNPEKCPVKGFKPPRGQDSRSPTFCVYPQVLFFLLINIYLLYFFLSLCGNSFLHNWQARALSLATGLVTRIGWEPKSCFKQRQAEGPWDWGRKQMPFPPNWGKAWLSVDSCSDRNSKTGPAGQLREEAGLCTDGRGPGVGWNFQTWDRMRGK